MISREITTNGVTLFTQAFGESANRPILLIMGAMASAVWWPEEFCRQLARSGRYVIRYDHRDTGQSTSYPPDAATYTVEDLADDAVGVLDVYGIERAHLVGMSLGGYLGQLIALKYKERVRTLALIASEALAATYPSIPPMDPAVLAYHAGAGALDWTDRAAVLDYQVGAWRLLSGTAHPFDEADIRAMAATDFDRTPNPMSAFNHARLSEAGRWLDRLADITAPVLIIHGTEDRVVRFAHAEVLRANIAGAKLVRLNGSGHELHRSDWPVILKSIEQDTSQG